MRATVLLCAASCCAAPAEPACEPAPGRICRVAGTGEHGAGPDGVPADESALYLPSEARTGPDGRLYVMDYNNHRLRAIGPDGIVSTVAGNGWHAYATEGAAALDSPFENPVSFAFAPNGTLHLVSAHDPRVLQIDELGRVRVVAGTGELGSSGDGGPARAATFTELTAIAFAPDGTLYVADGGAYRVRRIGGDGIIHAFAGSGVSGQGGEGGPAVLAELGWPDALALDSAGGVYIADAAADVVWRVPVSGVLERAAGGGAAGDGAPATEAALASPGGLAIASDGTLYIADTLHHRVRRVDAVGVITTVAGAGSRGLSGDNGPAVEAELSGPRGLEAHDDRLYIADQRNSCVRVVYLH